MTKLIKEASGEVTAAESGKYRIKVIQAGEGSSGFYPREVLERDGAIAFPAGTKLFANHPTSSEEWERPERSVNDIVGKTLTDAVYEDGALYAEVKYASWFLPVVEEFKDELGMSIYAYAESDYDTVGDYTGTIISKFMPAGTPNQHSIDVVTMAGAGGAILERITESFKRKAQESGNKPTATSAAGTKEEEGKLVSEVTDAIKALEASLSAKIDTLLATKTQEAQAEVDADAIAEAKKEAVEQFDAQADLIAKADLLPAQESALKSALKRGEDITDRLEEAKTVAKEAAELGASRGDRVAETGRFVAGKVTENAEPEKPVNLKGLFS